MAYVEAAKAMGVHPIIIIFRHIAPQCIAPLLVVASASLGGAIFAEAALSKFTSFVGNVFALEQVGIIWISMKP